MSNQLQIAPNTVDYYVNGVCNLKCARCRGPIHSKLIETLSIPDWQKISTQLHDLGTNNLTISGGEPLLKHGLIDIVSDAKDKMMKITLSTNAILLDRHMKLVSYVDALGIPIDGYDPESSQIMRDGSLKNFNRVLENIQGVQKIYPEKEITIRTVVSSKNKETIDKIGELLVQNGILRDGVRWKIYECSTYGPRVVEINEGKRKLGTGEFDLVKNKIQNIFKDQRVEFHPEDKHVGRYMFINPDGQIKIITEKGEEQYVGHVDDLVNVLNTYAIDNNDR